MKTVTVELTEEELEALLDMANEYEADAEYGGGLYPELASAIDKLRSQVEA